MRITRRGDWRRYEEKRDGERDRLARSKIRQTERKQHDARRAQTNATMLTRDRRDPSSRVNKPPPSYLRRAGEGDQSSGANYLTYRLRRRLNLIEYDTHSKLKKRVNKLEF